MNEDLVKAIAVSANLSEGEAEKIIGAFAIAITEELKRGKSVKIKGLGSFILSRHKQHTGINPHTGEPIEIPALTTVRFRPSKNLLLKDNSIRALATEEQI